MNRGPYAPPEAQVTDVLPVAARHWIRTKWLFLFLLGFLSFATWSALEALLPAFTLVAVVCGLSVGALFTVSPFQAILARRSGTSPWWWDVLFWCLVGTTLIGAALDELTLVVVGLLACLVLVAVMTLGTLFVEVRYGVRVYSKARGVVFVGVEDAL